MKGARAVEYVKPELEWIRFENRDILTESPGPGDMPIEPFSAGDFSD